MPKAITNAGPSHHKEVASKNDTRVTAAVGPMNLYGDSSSGAEVAPTVNNFRFYYRDQAGNSYNAKYNLISVFR